MNVEYINHMGDDLAVVNAARVSFAKQSSWDEYYCDCVEYSDDTCTGRCMFPNLVLKEDDAKLISYLARNNHWTPFAHTAISLRVSAPVPIRTQCFKHKQGLVENEESRRYIRSRPELYIPDSFRSAPTGNVKQGSGDTHPSSDNWKRVYTRVCEEAIDYYEGMIYDGIAPEQARFILPQGVEVNWVWTGNLYSFANFYNKRIDPHAQKEVRDIAVEVGKIIEPLFPVSWKALTTKE